MMLDVMPCSVSELEITAFLRIFSPDLQECLQPRLSALAEVHFDLGKPPKAVWLNGQGEFLRQANVNRQELQFAIATLGADLFDLNNRAGIEETLHRISVLRNRKGMPIGLSCRFGRAHPGLALGLLDLVKSDKSILLIGPPGVGKTCTLRGLIRAYAENQNHRVMVVDTNNEICGDGDVPHPYLSLARRIQVQQPANQHLVIIEAVANHMPTVVAIDEVTTEQQAHAVRSMAQRGIKFLASVHGESLQGLLQNPELNPLVGGMKANTLGDRMAKLQPGGFKKNYSERLHEVPFDTAIVLQDRHTAAVHPNLLADVDKFWQRQQPRPEIRRIVADPLGNVSEVTRTSQQATHAIWQFQTDR